MADFMPVAHTTMLNGVVDVGNSAVKAVRVGDSNLSERKWLYIMNAAGGTNIRIYLGSQSAVGTALTTTTLPKYGIKLTQGDAIWLPISSEITVYAMSSAGEGKRLRIAELA